MRNFFIKTSVVLFTVHVFIYHVFGIPKTWKASFKTFKCSKVQEFKSSKRRDADLSRRCCAELRLPFGRHHAAGDFLSAEINFVDASRVGNILERIGVED